MTNTATNTATHTNTFTFTNTATNTATPTATGSFTNTPTITNTYTVTNSPTGTPTATKTILVTLSATNSQTPTITCTLTATNTPASTANCSGIPDWSGNLIAYTVGQKVGYSGESYLCLTANTSQVAMDPPIAPSLWKDLGPCGSMPTVGRINSSPVVYPNPVTSSTVNIQMPAANLTDVKIQIFTLSFREVQTIIVAQVAGNTLTVPLMDKGGVALANGLYYFVIQAGSQKWLTKVLVLR
jgi:hypothetical protein